MISKHQEYPIVTNSMLFGKGAAWKYIATLLYVHVTYLTYMHMCRVYSGCTQTQVHTSAVPPG